MSFFTTLFDEFPIVAALLIIAISLFAGAMELIATKSMGPPVFTWGLGVLGVIAAIGSSSYNSILRLLMILVLLAVYAVGIRWIVMRTPPRRRSE